MKEPTRKTPSEIDLSRYTALPALIDPHVHFRTPGGEYKEDWKTGALAAIHGGVTTVCDMPNNTPPCTTLERLEAKRRLIDRQLKMVGIPLHYGLYFGADEKHLDQIPLVADQCVALKIFMGCSTGGLVIESDDALDEAFERAAASGLLVAVHAEDEAILARARIQYRGSKDPATHSLVRPREAAIRATEKAIALAKKHQARLYVLHISTREELDLIRSAKREGVQVYGETTTHHLYFTSEDYARLGTLIQMNPPIREKSDQEALWEALRDGTLDTVGTDHAPHTLEEKQRPYGEAPSGIPGVQTLLPLMLDAVFRGKITLERMVELTHHNPAKILNLPVSDDQVFVDLDVEKRVSDAMMLSRSGWTPYRGMTLRGWPVYTALNNHLFPVSR